MSIEQGREIRVSCRKKLREKVFQIAKERESPARINSGGLRPRAGRWFAIFYLEKRRGF